MMMQSIAALTTEAEQKKNIDPRTIQVMLTKQEAQQEQIRQLQKEKEMLENQLKKTQKILTKIPLVEEKESSMPVKEQSAVKETKEDAQLFKSHFIFYVQDQSRSTEFYSNVLGLKPTLNVPGMTEFHLTRDCIFGLMPETGIKRLLGKKLPDPVKSRGIPRSELYLVVKGPELFHNRAIKFGAIELSPMTTRNWGHEAAYSIDPDGHVLAFAKELQKPPPYDERSLEASLSSTL